MDNQNQGVFINGRAQIVEMFKLLNPAERSRLLEVIKIKNPALATELQQETVTFDSLENLGERELLLLINRVKPQVWGLALKGTKKSFQHKVLSLAPREYAETAFNVMQNYVDTESINRGRAQNKIIEVLTSLKRSNIL